MKKEKNKESEIEDVGEKKLDISKLIIKDIKSLGIYSEPISSKLPIYRINSVVACKDNIKRVVAHNPQFIGGLDPVQMDDGPGLPNRVRATTRVRPETGRLPRTVPEGTGILEHIRVETITDPFGREIPIPVPNNESDRLRLELSVLQSRRDSARLHRTRFRVGSPARQLAEDDLNRIEENIRVLRMTLNDVLFHERQNRGHEFATHTFYAPEPDIPKPSYKEQTFLEKRKNIYQSFRAKTGGKPAIIKGYVIKNKLYTTNEDIIADFPDLGNSELKGLRVIYKIFTLEEDNNNNSISSKIYCGNLRDTLKTITSIPTITTLLNIILELKIKSTDASSEIFGLASQKKELQESLKGEFKLEPVKEWEVEFGVAKKLNSETFYINIPIAKGNKKIKFLFEDCKFVNPALSGYTPPINKTFVVNSLVSVKESKKSDYKIVNDGSVVEGIILAIKANISSKKISRNCKSHRKDIITLKLIPSERIITIYAEDLKFIRRKYSNEIKKKIEVKANYQMGNYTQTHIDDLHRRMQEILEQTMFTTTPNFGVTGTMTTDTVMLNEEDEDTLIDLNF